NYRERVTGQDSATVCPGGTNQFRGAHAPSRADFGASPKCFSRQIKKVVGEAPTTAREACALPGPLSRRLRQLVGLRPKTSLNAYFPRAMIPSPAGIRLG